LKQPLLGGQVLSNKLGYDSSRASKTGAEYNESNQALFDKRSRLIKDINERTLEYFMLEIELVRMGRRKEGFANNIEKDIENVLRVANTTLDPIIKKARGKARTKKSLVALSEGEKQDEADAIVLRQRRILSRIRVLLNRIDSIDEEIIRLNYGLVLSYVKRFTSNTTTEDTRDFEGAGLLGLMRAVNSYDPSRGSKFSTWAFKPIQRECLRAVREADFKHLNPGEFEKRPEITRVAKELHGDDFLEDGVEIDYKAVAERVGTSPATVKRVIHSVELDSLSRPVGEENGTNLSDMLVDYDAGVEDQTIDAQEMQDLSTHGLSCLDERELFVVTRRFGLDGEPEMRLSAIGNILGLSREAVRQIEAKALSKLNHPTTLRRLARSGRK